MAQIRAILILSCLVTAAGCDENGSESSALTKSSASSQKAGKPNESKKSARIESPESELALKKFASDFENLSEQNRDQNTLMKQKDLALAALPKIGGGEEVLKFLDYLTERGAGDLRKELIEKHLGVIFTGPHAEEAREWLLTVQDQKLREQLCWRAGEVFSGVGFKEYFELMGEYGDLSSQAALLYGYCVTMAKTDPEAAVKVYKDFGYPKHIDNTGMANVMAALPPNTDFLKFATEIKEDSMTLAKRSRAALLRNWACVNPQDAAQYVLGNLKSGVAPDQMVEVVSVWAKTSPDSAASWLSKAPEGQAKDEGSAALARFWTTSDPVKAWENASKVGDFNKRVETATAVFKEWEKADRAAAEKAWVALFPPAQ